MTSVIFIRIHLHHQSRIRILMNQILTGYKNLKEKHSLTGFFLLISALYSVRHFPIFLISDEFNQNYYSKPLGREPQVSHPREYSYCLTLLVKCI
jgi:hypothetical protein